MSRSPVFQFDSPREAIQFSRRLPDFKDALVRSAEATSRHARLQNVTSHITGSDVYVRFDYTCGGAAGQNMVTIATQNACNWLRNTSFASELNIRNFLIEGNMSPDKKPSWGAVVAPRGVEVVSWAVLSDAACQQVLGCTTERLYKTHRLLQEGGIRNGQFGCNVNTANVVAAIFIATGQDVAGVAEGAWAHFICDYDYTSKSLKISLYMPSLPIGTVGGGTGYATQQEALQIMNCAGPDSKSRLGGIIAAFAIALEISTLAAGASDTFSESHQRLARKNKI
ncbi:nad-binding domain of hmg-CoA reductase [Aspergillus taichungensis]|uniref:hydroxymethylglutaryl-CoA reductase (NADPH) n=1 Tax=Aspergillus taichungensis TaxID=482145 RepID=A0A2J5HTE0_9EURO|nr:nad-binding domain of hmg-CoA reductase [Aspergillus taichungensis]